MENIEGKRDIHKSKNPQWRPRVAFFLFEHVAAWILRYFVQRSPGFKFRRLRAAEARRQAVNPPGIGRLRLIAGNLVPRRQNIAACARVDQHSGALSEGAQGHREPNGRRVPRTKSQRRRSGGGGKKWIHVFTRSCSHVSVEAGLCNRRTISPHYAAYLESRATRFCFRAMKISSVNVVHVAGSRRPGVLLWINACWRRFRDIRGAGRLGNWRLLSRTVTSKYED